LKFYFLNKNGCSYQLEKLISIAFDIDYLRKYVISTARPRSSQNLTLPRW